MRDGWGTGLGTSCVLWDRLPVLGTWACYAWRSLLTAFLGLEAPPLSSGAPRTPTSEHYGEKK